LQNGRLEAGAHPGLIFALFKSRQCWRDAMHAILGFFIVNFVAVGGLLLALAAISDGLQGL
jgi:hypothetical protein